MKLSESPEWIREFLEKKAPWWLEGGDDYLEVVSVDENRRTARVKKDGFTYTLDVHRFAII
jgi:hypothetical protein